MSGMVKNFFPHPSLGKTSERTEAVYETPENQKASEYVSISDTSSTIADSGYKHPTTTRIENISYYSIGPDTGHTTFSTGSPSTVPAIPFRNTSENNGSRCEYETHYEQPVLENHVRFFKFRV